MHQVVVALVRPGNFCLVKMDIVWVYSTIFDKRVSSEVLVKGQAGFEITEEIFGLTFGAIALLLDTFDAGAITQVFRNDGMEEDIRIKNDRRTTAYV